MERLITKIIGGFFMHSKRIQPLIESAIMAALALIIDLLPSISLGPWISISFAMVPVFIVSFRWGVQYGVLSGLFWGLLQVVTGDIYILHWLQFIIEYFIAFGCIGIAGLFMKVIQRKYAEGKKKAGLFYVVLGIFVGSLARYVWHYIAGIVFWGSYAPKGQPVWIYSLIVNGPAWLGSFIFCSIVMIFMLTASSRILTANKKK